MTEPLTATEEFQLYITKGVVPSMWAIRRALGEDREDVLAKVDSHADQQVDGSRSSSPIW